MKPDWDKLMDEFKDSGEILVADVDCTADGKELCGQHEIRGFPTIKHGSPHMSLATYGGNRDFAALKTFIRNNLVGSKLCSPADPDACDSATKEKILNFQALSADELDERISAAELERQRLEKPYQERSDNLRSELDKAKEDLERFRKGASDHLPPNIQKQKDALKKELKELMGDKTRDKKENYNLVQENVRKMKQLIKDHPPRKVEGWDEDRERNRRKHLQDQLKEVKEEVAKDPAILAFEKNTGLQLMKAVRRARGGRKQKDEL